MKLSALIIELQKIQAETGDDPEVGFWAETDMVRPMKVEGFWGRRPRRTTIQDAPPLLMLSPYKRP